MSFEQTSYEQISFEQRSYEQMSFEQMSFEQTRLLNKRVFGTKNVVESKGLVAYYLVINERKCLSISFQR
jgi:hypothetical protein